MADRCFACSYLVKHLVVPLASCAKCTSLTNVALADTIIHSSRLEDRIQSLGHSLALHPICLVSLARNACLCDLFRYLFNRISLSFARTYTRNLLSLDLNDLTSTHTLETYFSYTLDLAVKKHSNHSNGVFLLSRAEHEDGCPKHAFSHCRCELLCE